MMQMVLKLLLVLVEVSVVPRADMWLVRLYHESTTTSQWFASPCVQNVGLIHKISDRARDACPDP